MNSRQSVFSYCPDCLTTAVTLFVVVIAMVMAARCQDRSMMEPQMRSIPAPPVPFTKIYIGDTGIVFSIQYRDTMPPLFGPDQCGLHCGAITDCVHRTIMFWNGLPDQEAQRYTLHHELMHIASACADDDQITMHKAIYQLSDAMEYILSDKRNRGLVKWLYGL